MNVQFGCGGNVLPGFNNHDIEVDITKPLPYRDGEVDFVLAEHVSEHISGPQVLRFFKEVHRILRHGGTFRVCIPVLDRLKRDKAEDIITNHGHLTIWSEELIPLVLWVAGFNPATMGPVKFDPNIDGHYKVIGEEQDQMETGRFEAIK